VGGRKKKMFYKKAFRVQLQQFDQIKVPSIDCLSKLGSKQKSPIFLLLFAPAIFSFFV